MSAKPYTYVTLSIDDDRDPRIGVSFHTSALQASTLIVGNERPCLFLDTHEAQVSVSPSGEGSITEKDIATARAIFNAAAQYLADCERLHIPQPANEAAA
ncbi:hypothetical protein AB0F17_51720 [Nonomuraea sp. NPDC026600]|uniref:hypothetical protein n=1 Tax=Nonomuraea sp. NPDC026600 TaxID=3155363 RepID=UPI0033C77CC6